MCKTRSQHNDAPNEHRPTIRGYRVENKEKCQRRKINEQRRNPHRHNLLTHRTLHKQPHTPQFPLWETWLHNNGMTNGGFRHINCVNWHKTQLVYPKGSTQALYRVRHGTIKPRAAARFENWENVSPYRALLLTQTGSVEKEGASSSAMLVESAGDSKPSATNKDGGKNEEHCIGQRRALRWHMKCTAIADAAHCIRTCTALRFGAHASSARSISHRFH